MSKELSQKILITVKNCSDADIPRSVILEALNLEFETDEIVRYLKVNFESAVTSKMPIKFNREKMIEILLEAQKDQEPIQMQQNAINAALDPNLHKMVKTQSYKELEELMNPEHPINIYVSGETGLGKSSSVMYIKKMQGHPVIRMSLSYNTDVDDMIGGLRLTESESKSNTITSFQRGPVIQAMTTPNCCLLLDEVDTANPRVIIELQAVLEMKGYLIKKTGEMVYPAKGFHVVATGNTKGRGDLTNEHIGTNVLNKAFLDRFHTFVDFLPPTKGEMKSILSNDVSNLPDELYDCLAGWYEQIENSRKNGVSVQSISTRRMVAVTALMKSFGAHQPEDDSALKAIKYGTKIFEDQVSSAFLKLWDTMVVTSANERQRAKTTKKAASSSMKQDSNGNFIDEDGDIIPF